MPSTFSERQARARAAGLMSAAKNPDRAQTMRAARWNHFLAEARKLHPDADEDTAAGLELLNKTAHTLERAHMAGLSAKALKARRELREAKERAEAAEADLAEYPDAG